MTSDEIMKQALDITKAQAGVQPMTAAEIATYAAEVAKALSQTVCAGPIEAQTPPCEPKASIRESSITCLECGKTCKVLTIRHLREHGLDAKSYRTKWGLKKGTPLACKSLVRSRRKKMDEMQLWKRRKGYSGGEDTVFVEE